MRFARRVPTCSRACCRASVRVPSCSCRACSVASCRRSSLPDCCDAPAASSCGLCTAHWSGAPAAAPAAPAAPAAAAAAVVCVQARWRRQRPHHPAMYINKILLVNKPFDRGWRFFCTYKLHRLHNCDLFYVTKWLRVFSV